MGRFGSAEIVAIAVVVGFVWLVIRALWRVGSKPAAHDQKEPGAVRRFLDE